MACFNFASHAKTTVTIVTATAETTDGYGGFTSGAETELTVKAWVKPLSGREKFAFEANSSSVNHSILVRYNAALENTNEASNMTVKLDGRVLNVHYVRNLDADLKGYGKRYQELFVADEV